MSDAFTDVAKMKKIKEDIKAHEGQIVEMTLENDRAILYRKMDGSVKRIKKDV